MLIGRPAKKYVRWVQFRSAYEVTGSIIAVLTCQKETVTPRSVVHFVSSFEQSRSDLQRANMEKTDRPKTSIAAPASGGFTFSVNKPILQNKSPPGRCAFLPLPAAGTCCDIMILWFELFTQRRINRSICKLLRSIFYCQYPRAYV